jgi:poly [ADP-ribose] polymerase 10/14/15
VLQSAAALMERGILVRASEEDEDLLRAHLFESTSSVEFVAAYKVASGTQDRIYEALKSIMKSGAQESDDNAPLELKLWHGTSWAILSKILQHGFNRSFAGRHGTLLGMATYFSAKLSYSARFCDKHGGGSNGTKVALLSRVLVGKYCKGSPTDVEPPMLDAATGERYDSTVDNADNPSIFAVFRDFQALPLFLLEFR